MTMYVRAVGLAFASLMISGCAGESAVGQPSRSSRTASDFTTHDIDGKVFRMSDHLGKEVVILDFWASWSKPSRADLVHLQALQARYKSRGVLVVAVSMDGPETVAQVAQVARSYDLTFPVILDEDTTIAAAYNPKKSTPLVVVIDRAGNVALIREGYNPGDEGYLEADVERLVSSRASEDIREEHRSQRDGGGNQP